MSQGRGERARRAAGRGTRRSAALAAARARVSGLRRVPPPRPSAPPGPARGSGPQSAALPSSLPPASRLLLLLLLPLLLARSPAPAPAPPGRPGPRRREVVKIHVGRPRGEHRKGETSTPGPGPLGARLPPGVRARHLSCRVPLTRGELQCVIGGSRGVDHPPLPRLFGAGGNMGRPKGGFALMSKPPDWNKCTASFCARAPFARPGGPGHLPQSLSGSYPHCHRLSSPQLPLFRLAFPHLSPGVVCSRGQGSRGTSSRTKWRKVEPQPRGWGSSLPRWTQKGAC